MVQKLKKSWLILALIVAFGTAGVLIVRAVERGRLVHSAEAIRPWMSVPYIAHSRHIPQTTLWNALAITPRRHDHRPLSRIARDQRKPVEEIISTLKTVIDQSLKPRSAPTPPKAEP